MDSDLASNCLIDQQGPIKPSPIRRHASERVGQAGCLVLDLFAEYFRVRVVAQHFREGGVEARPVGFCWYFSGSVERGFSSRPAHAIIGTYPMTRDSFA